MMVDTILTAKQSTSGQKLAGSIVSRPSTGSLAAFEAAEGGGAWKVQSESKQIATTVAANARKAKQNHTPKKTQVIQQVLRKRHVDVKHERCNLVKKIIGSQTWPPPS